MIQPLFHLRYHNGLHIDSLHSQSAIQEKYKKYGAFFWGCHDQRKTWKTGNITKHHIECT